MPDGKLGFDRCYLIGIGGVSMSALAQYLKERGVAVRGSDFAESGYTRRLTERGISVHIGESQEISEDTVVFTGAIADDHPQLSAARRAGKRLIPRAELLGMVADCFSHVISIAGCHGKTTATAMLVHIFAAGERKFTSHVGGDDAVYGNYYSTGGEYFITEACEFRRSFLALHSEIAVILNTDRDHTDCYKSDAEVRQAYLRFAGNAKRWVVCAEDPISRQIPGALTYGRRVGDVTASRVSADGECYRFTVCEHAVPIVDIRLNVPGEVNILNALAAYCAARLIGFSASEIKRGIECFIGVRRRFEQIGTLNGVPVICDYAHHPGEIAAALTTAERMAPGTVRVVFQPHTYTRTRDLMQEFVAVLKRAERPIIYRTYAAREVFDGAGSAYMLTARIPEAVYVQSPEGLKNRLLENCRKGDVVLVLGAGDIDVIVREILDG